MRLKCFDESGMPIEQLDRNAYKFQHKLLGHPALSLENLGKVIPALRKHQVMFADRMLETDADFEGTFKERPRNRTIEEVIERIRISDSYIMVKSPEAHESFRDLYADLISDVETTMRLRGLAGRALQPQLYLFIASPNSVTPFHIDRYSTFLMQFRGSKQVTVFPQWDEKVVTRAAREAYVAYTSTRLNWSPDMDSLGSQFQFAPGDALHIPFIAGHHVRNGADDVSISMSIIFNTPETRRLLAAMRWNHWLHKRAGVSLAAVPGGALSDRTKAYAWLALKKCQDVKARYVAPGR